LRQRLRPKTSQPTAPCSSLSATWKTRKVTPAVQSNYLACMPTGVPTTPAVLSTQERYERALPAVRALARVSRVLEAASPDLSLAHYRVLSAVASGEERATLLAARLALGKPAVSAAVESLCRRGLLERLDVAGDARAVALSLTAQGALVLDRVEAEMTRRVVDLCARTSDQDSLLESLAQLGQAMDATRNERLSAQRADGR
jgi:DNA-binding MarR family transcriptional regulator